jgi:hypothetical protein
MTDSKTTQTSQDALNEVITSLRRIAALAATPTGDEEMAFINIGYEADAALKNLEKGGVAINS